jgi:hypothetical protein
MAQDMLSTFRVIANTILGRVPGKPDRADTATRMAMDADLREGRNRGTLPREPRRKAVPCEPQSEVNSILELERILKEGK